MPDYIAPPLVTEPADLADDAFAYLEAQVDGWLPSPGNLETWLIESQAQLAAEVMDVASAIPTSIFRYFGESILGLAPLLSVPAVGLTTWTVRDAQGYTIQAGTLVGIPAAGDVLLAFEVVNDTPVPVGATSVSGVIVIAQDAGAAGNGLDSVPQIIDALDFVVSVTLDAPTSGGADGESDAAYLDRLRELLTLLTPRPILPNDFAVLAKSVAGVFRATAIDLYNANTAQSGVPRCVTVVVADDDGLPVPQPVKDEVDALLQGAREVNFLVFVADPAYAVIAVNFTVKSYPGYDPADVVARAIDAVEGYLSPATSGLVPYGDQPVWLADTFVRYLEVAEAINRVEGVRYIGTLTVNGGTADVALPANGGLPKPGAITGAAIP